jgi:cell division protein FtsW
MVSSNLIPRKESPIEEKLKVQFDVWIVLAVMGLVIAGMIAVYTTSYDIAYRSGLSNYNPTYYFNRQFFFLCVGIVAVGISLQFDYHQFRTPSLYAMGGTLIMLVLVLIIGIERNGSRRWLFTASIQPSELAKLAMVLYVSYWLSTKGERIKSITYGLMPFGVMIGGICGLITLQPDVSTAALIGIIAVALFFLSGANLIHFVISGALATGGFVAVIQLSDYASKRVEWWQTAFNDPISVTQLQLKMIAMSLSTGGLWGKGPGQGEIKYFLPAAHTDGTFAVWGEEFGFIGCMFIILSFVLLAWRGVLAAQRARDMYGYLLAMGVTVWISVQALLNIAVITSTIPNTGMPLPFMAYGGTSLVMNLCAVALLLNVSRDARIGKTLRQGEFAVRQDEATSVRRRNGRSRLSRNGSHRNVNA